MVSLNYRTFSLHEESEESLDVSVTLRKKSMFQSSVPQPKREGLEEKWGTNVFCHGRVARYKSELMAVEYEEARHARVRAWYLLDRRNRIASLYKDVPGWDVCQRLMRLALHHPLFHMLGKRDMELLHAAAVASNGRALLIAGLNGCGKSSLCFDLLSDLDYMSDNYVLWNGEDVLGFPEAIKIPHADTARPVQAPLVFGKVMIPVERKRTVLRAKPEVLVFLTQGPKTAMTPLSPAAAARRIVIVNDMTHEFPRYNFLGPLSPPANPSRLTSLTRSVSAFALTMSSVESARELLLDLI